MTTGLRGQIVGVPSNYDLTVGHCLGWVLSLEGLVISLILNCKQYMSMILNDFSLLNTNLVLIIKNLFKNRRTHNLRSILFNIYAERIKNEMKTNTSQKRLFFFIVRIFNCSYRSIIKFGV